MTRSRRVERSAAGYHGSRMVECPEPSALVRFIEGALEEEQREAVALHVDACELCIDVVAAFSSPSQSSAEDAPPRSLEAGQQVGRYILLERIGAGGLGEVFAAYDPQLDRRIAIKVNRMRLFEHDVDPQRERRALKEAHALAALSHPNIITVHDAGVHGGRLFIAMEFIDGETLDAWRRRVEPGWVEIREMYVAAARGLAAAHQEGFVHRDFKPANVMLGPGRRVRVLDFGLAQHPSALRPSEQEAVPQSESVVGTPAYMAPEQLTGATTDARADVFAWCLSLLEALAGARLHRDEDGAVVLGPSSIPANVPRWLVRAAQRGVAVDPSDRFAGLDAAIEAVTADRRRGRTWRWIAAGAVLCAATAGTIVAVREPPPSAAALSRVAELSQEARNAAAKAYFVFPPPNSDEPTALQFIVELEEIRGVGDEGNAEAARLRAGFAETLVRLGDKYWEADGGRPFSIDYYALALVFEPEQERALARAALTRGEVSELHNHARTGEFTEAERSGGRVLIALAQTDQRAVDEQVAGLLAEENIAASTRGRLEKLRTPPAATRRVTTVAKSDRSPTPLDVPPEVEPGAPDVGGGADSPSVDPPPNRRVPASGASATVLVASAKKEWNAGNFAQAESLYHQALGAKAQHVGALRGLAQLHREQGKYAKALRFARAAVKARPKDGGLHILLGEIHFRSSRYADARAAFERAQDLGHPDAADRISRVERRTSRSR